MTLLFARHGQASFDGPDYDELSPLGRRQARALGRWLGARHPELRLLAGPRRRHVQTAEEARLGAQEVGARYEPVAAAPLLDEVPVDDIVRVYLPRLGQAPADLVGLPRAERIAVIYRAVGLWWSDTAQRDDFESAARFEARIGRAIDELAFDLSAPRCVVTSAGPLYAALARLPSTRSAVPVEPADIANCAVVELRATGGGTFASTALAVADFLPAADVTFI